VVQFLGSTSDPCQDCNNCDPCQGCNNCESCQNCQPCQTCESCQTCQSGQGCDPCLSVDCGDCYPCLGCDPCNPCQSSEGCPGGCDSCDSDDFQIVPDGAVVPLAAAANFQVNGAEQPENVQWSADSPGTPESSTGSVFSVSWSTAGVGYTVTATENEDADAVTVDVVGVKRVEYKTESMEDYNVAEGTIYVPEGEEVLFRAVRDPEDAPNWPPNYPVAWEVDNTYRSSGEEFFWSFPTASTGMADARNVRASCGSSSKSVQVVVVKVARIEYHDPNQGWKTPPNPLCVIKGTMVTFRAVPQPTEALWPEQTPRWMELGPGTFLGEEVTQVLHFDQTSPSLAAPARFAAKCGNSVEANVATCELKPKLQPDDAFAGRSENRFGLMEKVSLSFETLPEGVTADSLGGLEWSKTQGNGTVTPAGLTGTGQFVAGDVPTVIEPTELRLTVATGPSQGQFVSKSVTIVTPSGGHVENLPGAGIFHVHDTFSIMILCRLFLRPTDVSFAGLLFEEGECSAQTSGWFARIPEFSDPHPRWEVPNRIGNGDLTLGCEVQFGNRHDMAGALGLIPNPPPYEDESVLFYDIPWRYSPDGGDTFVVFHNMPQLVTVDSAGNANVIKGAAQGANNHSDPNQSFGIEADPPLLL